NSKFLKETLWRIYEQDAPFRDALDRAVDAINGEVDALDALLDAQWYRLAYWRIASETINDRRFFDVADLVAMRLEDPEVVQAPNALFVDPARLAELDDVYRRFTGTTRSFEDLCYERKKQVIAELFSGEMRDLGKQLSALAMADRNARDFAPTELLAALTEVTACMRVYRTYIRNGDVTEEDRAALGGAIAEGRQRAAASLDQRLFAFLERVLLVDPPPYLGEERERWLTFVMRWPQFTGRVMAQGAEDTADDHYHRPVSPHGAAARPG